MHFCLFPDPSTTHQSGQADTFGGQDDFLELINMIPITSKEMIKITTATINTVF
jgi:hypothetical protein